MITFITGNIGKLNEVKSILDKYVVVSKDIDLTEIQDIDPYNIIKHKLLEAYKYCTKGNIIVDDTSLYFDVFNGFPGPLNKWLFKKMSYKQVFDILKKLGNTKAQAVTIIGFIDKNKNIKYFEGIIKGQIVSPKGKNGHGWDMIFMPNGSKKTFAQMTFEEKNNYSMRKIALNKLKKYLKKENIL